MSVLNAQPYKLRLDSLKVDAKIYLDNVDRMPFFVGLDDSNRVGWNQLTPAVKQQVGAAVVENAPDDITLELKIDGPDTTIGIKAAGVINTALAASALEAMADIVSDSIAFPVDTTALKLLNMAEGRVAYLKQLSGTDSAGVGAGFFVVTDSLFTYSKATYGYVYKHPTAGLQWIRDDFNYAVWVNWYGANGKDGEEASEDKDSTAFANALASGHDVYVRDGVFYNIGNHAISGYQQGIYGADRNRSVLVPGTDDSLMFHITGAHHTVHGFIINTGEDSAQVDLAMKEVLRCEADFLRITNMTIYNCNGGADDSTSAIAFKGGSKAYVTISNCWLVRNDINININGKVSNLVIDNCQLLSPRYVNLWFNKTANYPQVTNVVVVSNTSMEVNGVYNRYGTAVKNILVSQFYRGIYFTNNYAEVDGASLGASADNRFLILDEASGIVFDGLYVNGQTTDHLIECTFDTSAYARGSAYRWSDGGGDANDPHVGNVELRNANILGVGDSLIRNLPAETEMTISMHNVSIDGLNDYYYGDVQIWKEKYERSNVYYRTRGLFYNTVSQWVNSIIFEMTDLNRGGVMTMDAEGDIAIGPGSLKLGENGAVMDTAKVSGDALKFYVGEHGYDAWEDDGNVVLNNMTATNYIKIGTGQAQIDSAKVVADTLKFYVGGVGYNALKE